MKTKLMAVALLATIAITGCKKDETTTTPAATSTSSTSTTNTTGTIATKSSYTFSDDGIECTPLNSGNSISPQGILSIVSKPCQDASAKFDGYFKYGSKPKAGTYSVVGSAGNFPINLGATQFSMLFYNHAGTTWYSTGGTVTLTTNASDTTKLDMTWKDMTVVSDDGSKTTKFSGTLLSL